MDGRLFLPDGMLVHFRASPLKSNLHFDLLGLFLGLLWNACGVDIIFTLTSLPIVLFTIVKWQFCELDFVLL